MYPTYDYTYAPHMQLQEGEHVLMLQFQPLSLR